jgi:hypothetical protein
MTVRRLRARQRGPCCSWCEKRAIHRGVLFTKFACDVHLIDLQAADDRQEHINRLNEGDGLP